LAAFEDLDAADTLELLAKAQDPAQAARLSTTQISAALKRARRRDIAAKAATIKAVLRAEHLGKPAVVTQRQHAAIVVGGPSCATARCSSVKLAARCGLARSRLRRTHLRPTVSTPGTHQGQATASPVSNPGTLDYRVIWISFCP
jgi:hypothetical protein